MGMRDRIVATLGKALGITVPGTTPSMGRAIFAGATVNGGFTKPRVGVEWLEAFNTMPWLRATVGKIARGVSTLDWGITRTMEVSPVTLKRVTVRRGDLQRASFETRQKALAAMADEGTAEAVFEHPFLTLLANPCPALPGKSALWLAQVYYEIPGEVFFVVDRGPRDGWIKSDVTGKPLPTALWPIPPHWVARTPTVDRPTFELRQNALQMTDLPMSEILWLKNPDPVNPYGRGVGDALALRDELDADENAAKLISYSFYNRNRPDVLVALPGWDEKEIQAFRDNWVANLQGVQNALKSHFVNVEAKVEQLGYDFKEMQVVELRRYLRDTIRQAPGIPPELLGILDQSNRSTIDAAEYMFGKHVIIPRAEVWREFWQSQLVVEYDPRALLDYVSPLQEDKNYALSVATQRSEAFRIDEVRKLAGQPALGPELGGDLFIVKQGTTAVASLMDLVAQAAPGMAPGASPSGLDIQVPGMTPGGASPVPGGINVPGATAAPLPGGRPPTALPAPAGTGPGFSLDIPGAKAAAGEPSVVKTTAEVVKIHSPHIVEDGGSFKVVDSDGHVYGTHKTKPDAEAQMAALYAARADERSSKAAARVLAFKAYARNVAELRLSPDEITAMRTWVSRGFPVRVHDLTSGAREPVSEHRSTEYVRRCYAYMKGLPTAGWDGMFGQWSDADCERLDAMLQLKEWNEEDHPRDEFGRFDGGGAGGRALADDIMRSESAAGPSTSPRASLEAGIQRAGDYRAEAISKLYSNGPTPGSPQYHAAAAEIAKSVHADADELLKAAGLDPTKIKVDPVTARPIPQNGGDDGRQIGAAIARLEIASHLAAQPEGVRVFMESEGYKVHVKSDPPTTQVGNTTFVSVAKHDLNGRELTLYPGALSKTPSTNMVFGDRLEQEMGRVGLSLYMARVAHAGVWSASDELSGKLTAPQLGSLRTFAARHDKVLGEFEAAVTGAKDLFAPATQRFHGGSFDSVVSAGGGERKTSRFAHEAFAEMWIGYAKHHDADAWAKSPEGRRYPKAIRNAFTEIVQEIDKSRRGSSSTHWGRPKRTTGESRRRA